MLEDKRRIRRIFWVTLLSVSLLLGAAFAALEVSRDVRNVLMALWLGAVAVASVTIDLLWYRSFNRRLQALGPILTGQNDPDRYIEEISALLEGKKSPQLRGILLINLCAAYCDKKEYDIAQALLMQVKPKKLAPINRMVYWADLAYVHFYLQEDAQACAILAQQQKMLAKFQEHPHFGGLIHILFAFQKVAQGDKAGAEALLKAARPRWETARNAHDFEHLAQLCQAD